MKPSALFNPDSKLYFPVSKRSVYYPDDNQKMVPSPTHAALVRDDDGTQLEIVGKDYAILHNTDLYPAIETSLLENIDPKFLEGLVTKESMSYGGRFCMKEYVFRNIGLTVDKPDKPILFRTIVINGYGGSSVKVITGAIDSYCSNGIVRGSFEKEFKRHTSAQNVDVKQFTNAVQKSIVEYASFMAKLNTWKDIEVPEETAMEFLQKLVMSDKLREGLMERFTLVDAPDRGQNLWGLYSSLTYYASHIGGDEFKIRDTGTDNKAAIRIHREQQVAKWMNSLAAHETFGTRLDLSAEELVAA